MMLGRLKFLFGADADFYPFERGVLSAVKACLDAEGAAKLQRQIEVINKIQRLADGKEVNLYQMRFGRPAFDDNFRFPKAAEKEELLASANLIGLDKQSKLKVEAWLAKGRLFSLLFSQSPSRFFDGASLKAVQPQIADVKIWFDPMRPPPVTTGTTADASVLTGWLREWYAKGWLAGLRAPLPGAERAAYLERIDALLPSDYLDLVTQTEGATLTACVAYGVAGIRKVVWPKANYYLIAEIGELGALAVKEGQQNAELYFLHYEDNNAQRVGTSLVRAVTDLLKLA